MNASIVGFAAGLAFCTATASVPVSAQPSPASDTAQRSPGTPVDSEAGSTRLKWTTDIQVVTEMDLVNVRNDSGFNPQNRIANLADAQVLTEFRPDLTLGYGRVSFAISPRVTVGRVVERRTATGGGKGLKDAYVNTWRVKAQIANGLSASYGREVVQWGNGLFRSPSNPFFADNGRLNPVREIEGREFATVTYTPSLSYAVSFLSNTGSGRTPGSHGDSFDVINAIKFDYVGDAFNAVIIGSKQQGQNVRLGASYTYTASDALLLYGEMSATRGSAALYPEPGPDAVGWRLTPRYQDSKRLFYSNLLGASYTFGNGLVLSTEYANNNEGYGGIDAGALTSLGRAASSVLQQGGPDSPLAGRLLGQGLDTGLRLERRQYVFVQLLKTEYRNRADIAVSYARNLDGGGGMFSSYFTYNLTNRSQLFAVGSWNTGSADTEFARLYRQALSTGVRVTF
jgi:hypothetical protein